MTIAIAIACADGVVLASDSRGSSDRVATQVDKVRCATTIPMAWATAGSEFMIQAVENAILNEEDRRPSSPLELASAISPSLEASLKTPRLPRDGETSVHHVEALLIGWLDGSPSIIHLPSDLAPIECVQKRFVAIGSAHDFAHVVREALAHHLEVPILTEQGKLLAYRIVAAVCAVSSWGVALPVQMATVDSSGAAMISNDELEQLDAGVQRWTASEAEQFSESEMPSVSSTDGLPPSVTSAEEMPS
ncbi:hypothetical protein GON03_13425 [Nocardioides sp. MAH-18]|uniref:Proteasome protein n=1 Tax=Nocardioides agri TaxID=2682843 RepID=A0A6L6XS55_9ACTN|nr:MULTISPECIES: hypothetical protein [unclassified Nocardioides]MBA2955333.1 hypothetical protein [Nocardioides sp. CGMCC 1.13656]MVQ50184.1 hypothetical protein [Nocardioides sp. MAH-18]